MESAVIQPLLASNVWPTMIAEEDHERIISDTLRIEPIQNCADFLVKHFDAR